MELPGKRQRKPKEVHGCGQREHEGVIEEVAERKSRRWRRMILCGSPGREQPKDNVEKVPVLEKNLNIHQTF